jgi:hypothetical protein
MTKCQLCGRSLTNEQSIATGIGPECAGKWAARVSAAGSNLGEIASLTALNLPEVERWVGFAIQALRHGHLRNASCFFAQARSAARQPQQSPTRAAA